MRISEIFYSLQGEGRYAGCPSVFIRTAGCNLRCVWCDTRQAISGSDGVAYTIPALLQAVSEWEGVGHYVITGGEPMLQPELPELLQALQARGHYVTVETAGTLYSDDVRPDLFSISPKLSNSFPPDHSEERKIHGQNLNYDNLHRFLDLNCQFKFVVASPADVDEIMHFAECHRIPRNTVMLMPCGVTRSELQRRRPMVAELCKRHRLAYSPRLHIELWDGKPQT